MIDEAILLAHPQGEERDLAAALVRLAPRGLRVTYVSEAAGLDAALERRAPYALLVVSVASEEAWALIARVRAAAPLLPILATAVRADVDLAERTIKAGATDLVVVADRVPERLDIFLRKLEPLRQVLDAHTQMGRERDALLAALGRRGAIIGTSAPMRAMLEKLERVARVPRPVLIMGERGTGKELVARAVHEASGRGGPLISVNCAAFSDDLLESELFGHERGAYTGADQRQSGRFEQADGGTLFLDEIGNMSPAFQRKILRVVEYGAYTPLGSDGEKNTSARILAATNVDLHERIRQGLFLSDLYDRLAFEVIDVPPLRERGDDVVLLAEHQLRTFAEEVPTCRSVTLAPSALAALRAHPFPGNVRELKHAIERAAYGAGDRPIEAADLALDPATDAAALPGGFSGRVAAFSRGLLAHALAATEGNQAAAARRLGLTYDRFRYHARKHGLLT